MTHLAAIFCEMKGVYDRPGIEVWDVYKDARKYNGPYPVIAHPPCQRWGFNHDGTVGHGKRPYFKTGSDGGCFESALASVRKYGGVLEHPRASRAWDRFGINKPGIHDGWIPAGDMLGYTCCVEQGSYGHLAKKATWLYAVIPYPKLLPILRWGHSRTIVSVPDMGGTTKRERTPLHFRNVLIEIAALCYFPTKIDTSSYWSEYHLELEDNARRALRTTQVIQE